MRLRILLVSGLPLFPGPAEAFTCEQVVWAAQHFSNAQFKRMAARVGVSDADRAKAQNCLREAGLAGISLEVSDVSAVADPNRPGSAQSVSSHDQR